MKHMRLQKYLSVAGACSRRKGEQYILQGRVQVNYQVVSELGSKVDPAIDHVQLDGQPIVFETDKVYIALNKPAGYVSSCRQTGELIILDLIDIPQRLYPIGRLDKDSVGLLLLTNDGQIHHRLSHPSFDHEKEYRVTVDHHISDEALRMLAQGIELSDGKTRPARVKRIAAKRFCIILREGRNRQVRRMVGKLGRKVVKLQRVRFANIKLGKLPLGKWRHLTVKERMTLLESRSK